MTLPVAPGRARYYAPSMSRITAVCVCAAMIVGGCGGSSDDATTKSSVLQPGDRIDDVGLDVVAGDEAMAELDAAMASDVRDELETQGVALPSDSFVISDAAYAEAQQLIEELQAEALPDAGIDAATGEPAGVASPTGSVDAFSGTGQVVGQIPLAGPLVMARSAGASVRAQESQQTVGLTISMLFAKTLLDWSRKGAEKFDTGSKDVGSAIGSGQDVDLAMEMSRDGNRVSATGGFGLTQKMTVDGKTVTVTTKGKVKLAVDLCPDANGLVNVEFHVVASTSAAVSGAGSGSSDMRIDGTAVATVDDSAEISDVTMEFDVKRGSRGTKSGSEANPRSSYIESRWQMGFPSGIDLAKATYTGEVVRNSSKATQADWHESRTPIMVVATVAVESALDIAREHWQTGNCVKLIIDAPARAKPRSKHSITAMVHHGPEDVDLELPVTASVTAGGESIDPSKASGKPAEFTYTAPEKAGVTATVSFEVRSKRGADQKSVDIEIRKTVWDASTQSGRISISGTVTDIEAPFTLDGEFEGGEAVLTFVPTNEHGGTYRYTGGGSGVTVRGRGTYTLEEGEGEVLTLRYSGSGCAKPGVCGQTSAVVTLTPQE